MEAVMEKEVLLPSIWSFDHTGIDDLISWYKGNQPFIDETLLSCGGILLRGVGITDLEKFEKVIHGISQRFMDYTDGNSPRTRLSSNVFTSTEFDRRASITLHNELSYSSRYPGRIYFCCIRPAASGGKTPIADCRRILEKMSAELVKKIEDTGIRYIRNLHGGMGLGPSWQYTFQTTDRREVEEFCRQGDTEFEWKEDGGIRLIQKRRGIISHPVSGEKVWFSQIDQFHPFHLEPDQYEALMASYEDNEEDLPMYVTFGDGSKIANDTIRHIMDTVHEQSCCFSWRAGDLLILDNILVSHGRRPYEGDRKVLVAMS
jgi:hypothetical protein